MSHIVDPHSRSINTTVVRYLYRRALSPGEASPRDRLPDTLSPVNYWEEYDQSKDQDIIDIY